MPVTKNVPIEDLDLEFEDEEELAAKKKGDAVNFDVDLDFTVSGIPNPLLKEKEELAKLEAQKLQQQNKPQAPSTNRPLEVVKNNPEGQASRPSIPASNGNAALKIAPEVEATKDREQVAFLTNKINEVEHEAKVKVEVAEFKAIFMSDVLSDVKLLDHQINQLLLRINTKHPDLKPEILAIKKALADFLAKKRK
jgi:hypothetical protein